MLRKSAEHGFSVVGTYPAGDGSPDWSWRIRLSQDQDGLDVVMFNIPPDGAELPAVEMRCRRGTLGA